MSRDQVIREFLAEQVTPPRSPAELDDDFMPIEAGGMDSLSILHLVAFLEDEFDIRLDNDDLVLDNFATVGAIVRLAESKAASDE